MQTGERYPFSRRLFSILWLKIGLLALTLPACRSVGHYLNGAPSPLLRKNTLEFKSLEPLPLAAEAELKAGLSSFFRQKPNGLGKIGVHFRFSEKKSPVFRWLRRQWGAPPVFLDQHLTERTCSNFQNYLRQRGYMEAKCRYEISIQERIRKKRSSSPLRWEEATVSYVMDLGPLYRIESVSFASPDSEVNAILQLTAGGSLLRRSGALDRNVFEAEKNRIAYIFKNRGYALFQPSYVEFTGDSTGTQTRVTVEVTPPEDSSTTQVFRIGRVEVFLDFLPELIGARSDTTLQGIYFATSSPSFIVKPTRLLNIITIRPDSIFRQEDLDLTQRNLNAVGVFQFVTIRPQLDTLLPGVMHITITLALNKRFAISTGIDANYSSQAVEQTGNLLGFSAYVSPSFRNLLKGAEQLRSEIAGNIEIDVPNRQVFSGEFRLQNELLLPRYFDYLNLSRGVNRLGLTSGRFYERLRRDGRTRIGLNYSLLNVRDFYTSNFLNIALGHSLRLGARHHLIFDNLGIDLLRPRVEPRFDSIFNQSEFLRRSFGDQLFTGFFMRSIAYFYTGRPNVFGERWFFRANAELSGLEVHLINQLWSRLFGAQQWAIAGMDFSKYLRLDASVVYTRDLEHDITLAFRVGSGIALPYGSTTDVPFVKQFFVGGPFSIRAWRIREIGPGGYASVETSPPFYQAADFRFEFNGEVRFPILWWFKGAVFVDGGNIWTLKPDPDRPGSGLSLGSFSNMALGTGVGLRLDFDFFVVRFDLGLKLRRPFRKEGGGYWLDWRKETFRDFSNLNVAIGYPF